MTLEALIRTARRRRFAALQMGDELLAADWGMVLERLERLGGPPSDREDAERYRWLRGGPDIPPHSERWPRWEVRHWTGGYWDTLFADALDAAIDAARKREGA